MLPGPGRKPGSRELCFYGAERGAGILNIYIDTCVLPRAKLENGQIYRDEFGRKLGFELLAMFDLPDFEENLKKNRDMFLEGPLFFHEPVWGVEHSAPRGSEAYEESMYHMKLTRKWAEILHPEAMVYHLNNGPVIPGERERMIRTTLDNLEEIREMFAGTRILVENTGIHTDGTMLLDQDAFTELCISRDLPVLIDVGHANANGWDLKRLITDLRQRIAAYHLHNNDGLHDLHDRLHSGTINFGKLIPFICEMTPDASGVIEYTRPSLHGSALAEDIRYLQKLTGQH